MTRSLTNRTARLALLAVAAASCIVSSQPPFQVPHRQPSQNTAAQGIQQQGDRWEFLKVKITEKAMPLDEVVTKYVPLSPEKIMSENTPEFYEAAQGIPQQWLTQEVRRRGYNMAAAYDVFPSSQLYGVPLEERLAEQLKDFSMQAFDYVYSRIQGLEPQNMEWTIIMRGESYAEDNSQRAFLGHSIYRAVRLHVRNRAETRQSFVTGAGTEHMIGSAAFVGNNTSHIFLSPGPDAIIDSVSEPIHLTTGKRSNEYEREAGYTSATEAEEALAHGIGQILAHDFARKLGIPDWERIVNESLQELLKEPRYRHVPSAARWLQEHGIQTGFDMYMRSPGEFMNAITGQK